MKLFPSKKEMVVVYMDGSNTYNKLKSLGLPESDKRFDFDGFISYLATGKKLMSKRYYVGIVRNHDNTEKGEKMARSQQKFLEGLRNCGFVIKQGRIMYDGKDRIREKGVDVKMAIEIVTGAVDNYYDTAIVVSSDTDLIPAIKYVRSAKRKKVEYVGFAGEPSLGLIKETDTQRVLTREELVKFQINKSAPSRDGASGA